MCYEAIESFFRKELDHFKASKTAPFNFKAYFLRLLSKYKSIDLDSYDHNYPLSIIASFFSSLSNLLSDVAKTTQYYTDPLVESEAFILAKYFLYCSSYPIKWKKHSYEILMKAWRKMDTRKKDPIFNLKNLKSRYCHTRTSLHGFDQIDFYAFSSKSFALHVMEYKGQLSYRNLLINTTNSRYRNSEDFSNCISKIVKHYKKQLSFLLNELNLITEQINDFLSSFIPLIINRYKYTATSIGNDFLLKLSSGNFLHSLMNENDTYKNSHHHQLKLFMRKIIQYNQLIALAQNARCFDLSLEQDSTKTLQFSIKKNTVQEIKIEKPSGNSFKHFSFRDFLIKIKIEGSSKEERRLKLHLSKRVEVNENIEDIFVEKKISVEELHDMISNPSLFLQAINEIQSRFLYKVLEHFISTPEKRVSKISPICYSLHLSYRGNKKNLDFVSQRMSSYLIYKYNSITNLVLPKRVIFNPTKGIKGWNKISKSFNLQEVKNKLDISCVTLSENISFSNSFASDKSFFFIMLLKKEIPFIFPRLTHFENNNSTLEDPKYLIFYTNDFHVVQSNDFNFARTYYPRIEFSWKIFFNHIPSLDKYTMSNPFTIYKEREGFVFRLFRKPNTQNYIDSWKKLLQQRDYDYSVANLLDQYNATKGITIRKKGKKCQETIQLLYLIAKEYIRNWEIFSEWIQQNYNKSKLLQFEPFVDRFFHQKFKIVDRFYYVDNKAILPAVSTINDSKISLSYLFPSHNIFLLEFVESLKNDIVALA